MSIDRFRPARFWLAATASLGLLAGCPSNPGDDSGPVVAEIGISATRGPAPLRVTVSGSGSRSSAGAVVSFAWDFAGQAQSQNATASHTFTQPGLYPVRLTVRDSAENSATAITDVRVAGVGATAVISADRQSGTAPLTIQFSGRGSSAPDDTIRDYFWDFGDGGTERRAEPYHVFNRSGTFTVRLRVVTAGGVEASSEVVIDVSQRTGSLQFFGDQFASLPAPTTQPAEAFTLEAWFKPATTGGAVLTLGEDALGVSVAEGATRLNLSFGETTLSAVAAVVDAWHHVAVVSAPASGVVLYLDGGPVATGAGPANMVLGPLTLGGDYVGKLADVRVWSVERSAAQVAAGMRTRPSGNTAGLLGLWPLNEGRGQTLRNQANSLGSGTLGADTDLTDDDPAWSPDAP